MKTKLMAVLVAALFVRGAAAFAEVIIPRHYHVANEDPGYCAWCCLETLGRTQGVKALYGLKEARKKEPGQLVFEGGQLFWRPNYAGHPKSIRAKLDALGVDYLIQTEGWHDVSVIRDAHKAGRAVVVGVHMAGLGYHTVILTELGDERVKYVDPNVPGYFMEDSRAWFDGAWSGYTIEIRD